MERVYGDKVELNLEVRGGEPHVVPTRLDIAKRVRADLKTAQRTGELPTGLTFSVTTHRYSGGQALDVTVKGASNAWIYAPEVGGPPGYSQAARDTLEAVEAIRGAYDWNGVRHPDRLLRPQLLRRRRDRRRPGPAGRGAQEAAQSRRNRLQPLPQSRRHPHQVR